LIFEGDGAHPSPQYSQRASMYGVGGIPHAQFQGTNDVIGGGTNMLPYYTTEYNNFVNVDSPLLIDLAFNVNDDGQIVADANVEVTGALTPGDTNKFLFFLTYYYSDSYSCSVQRYEEFDFDLTNVGETATYTSTFDPDADWDMGNVRVVAAVQKWNGSTGNYPIHQGAIATYPLSVPNPVNDLVMDFNDTYTHDLTNYFYYNGAPVDADITVQSSDPSIVDATLDGNTLTLTSFDLDGPTQIDIIGTYNGYTAFSSFAATVIDPNNRYVLIWDLDPTPTGPTLASSIENFYSAGNVHIVSDFSVYPLSNADALFILLGIYSNNHVFTNGEVGPAVDYLNAGGNVYLEGGDTWAYDTATTLHGMFNINGTSDGSANLSNVNGQGFLDGMSWSYSGENNYIDHLDPLGSAFTIFSNPSPAYDCGIAYDSGTYKTVGTSFEITGLGGTNSLDDAVSGIIDFFGIGGVPLAPPENLQVTELGVATWDPPSAGTPMHYNVYLDDMNTPIAQHVTETTFTYSNLVNGQTYNAGVSAFYFDGESTITQTEFVYTGTGNDNELLPTRTMLFRNYPNPFKPMTTIAYQLKKEDIENASLAIYNVKGQEVKSFNILPENNGFGSLIWNGRDDNNKPISSGIYFYRIEGVENNTIHKMIMMK